MNLTNRLKHVKLIKSVIEQPGWQELENTMRANIKRKRIERDSLNFDSSPADFLAFKEKASFITGFIQGAEYMLNDVTACLTEEADLEKTIKQLEKDIKAAKRGS